MGKYSLIQCRKGFFTSHTERNCGATEEKIGTKDALIIWTSFCNINNWLITDINAQNRRGN